MRKTRVLNHWWAVCCGLVAAVVPGVAKAQGCSSSANDCWTDHSGSNYAQVAVAGGPQGGAGCAVFVENSVQFYDGFQCFKPSGTFGVGFSLPPSNMHSIFGNTTATRIRSIAVQPFGTSTTQFAVYVLRTDGNLYEADWRTTFIDNLRLIASPVDTNGNALSFKQMSAGRRRDLLFNVSTFIVGVGTNGHAYMMSGGRWGQMQDSDFNGGFLEFAYGSDNALGAITLTDNTSRPLITWWQNPLGNPSITPSNLFHSGLANYPNFLDGYGFPSQPVSFGSSDAWMVTRATNVDVFIKRSQLVNGSWTSWASFPTAPFTDFDTPQILPWQIVDAEAFWVPARRGNLMGIGDDYHLVSYHAP